MELPTDEQRLWRELEVELARDRRLVAHVAGFGAVVRWRSNMATARAGAAIPAVIWLPAAMGGCLGLALLIAGALDRSKDVSTVGTAALVTILILAGAALLATGIAGCRNVAGRDRQV